MIAKNLNNLERKSSGRLDNLLNSLKTGEFRVEETQKTSKSLQFLDSMSLPTAGSFESNWISDFISNP